MLLANLLDNFVLVCMDGVLINSKIAEYHVVHVEAVFECLAANNLHVKEKKCALFLPEVEFLGHALSAEGVRVAVNKFDAVLSWPMPIRVWEL